MRIVYGVHGYGRGHATRALAILPDLARNHDLLVLAGGDAYDAIHEHHRVTRIPTLGYAHRTDGTQSHLLTLKRNLPGYLDLRYRGPAFQMVEAAVRDFDPQAAISDAEPWTHRVAARLGIFRIGIDHFGIMVYCRPAMRWIDRIVSYRDAWVYRHLMGDPDRAIVSSFYDAPTRRPGVRVVGTPLRPAVFQFQASTGTHLLAYFNRGVPFCKRIRTALRKLNLPVLIFGTRRIGTEDNLEFCPRGDRTFLQALASCRAVISSAGNQLVGEALHFGKPMFVIPENCVEQRMNAVALAQNGIGMWSWQRRVHVGALRRFMDRVPTFSQNLKRQARDGRQEILAALNGFFAECGGAKRDTVVAASVA